MGPKYIIIIVLLILTACGAVSPWKSDGVYVGYYEKGFELSIFKPMGTTEIWWVEGNTEEISDLFVLNSGKYVQESERPIYVVVRGKLSEPGSYGHMNRYKRRIYIDNVIEYKTK